MVEAVDIADKVMEALEDSKAHQIVKIDLRKIENCFCSFFVICHGTSGTHIAGMTNAIEEKVRKDLHEKPFHIEGTRTSHWTVMDYCNVVVHIFDRETREHYQLEEFWGDGIITENE